MLSVAPASVLFMGLLGMSIVAFAVMRMTIAEHRVDGRATPARRVALLPPGPSPAKPRASV